MSYRNRWNRLGLISPLSLSLRQLLSNDDDDDRTTTTIERWIRSYSPLRLGQDQQLDCQLERPRDLDLVLNPLQLRVSSIAVPLMQPALPSSPR